MIESTLMLTKDDLKSIAGLIESGFVAEREHTRKIVREEVALNNAVLGTIFKVEQAETNEKIDKVQSTLDEKAEERFKQLEDRIQTLEEQLRKVKAAQS